MGIIGYYRKFIQGFSRIANPITALQKKGKKIVWDQKWEDSFNKLKELLTTAPILKNSRPRQRICRMHRCMQWRLRRGTNIGRSCNCTWNEKIKNSRKKLCNFWSRVGYNNPHFKNVASSLNSKIFLLMFDNISLKYLFD